MRVLDLFSGIGGFSLGLERAGFRTVAFCEVAPKCRHLLNYHWPEVPCYDDVCTLTAERLATDGIGVDAICGGFPCQDISLAGSGAGIEGERSGLWREYARLIGELRPRLVFVENVSALLVRGLGRVLGDLAALGYDAWWDCIPASAVGAPHRRDRLWLVAYPGGVEHQGYSDALRRAFAAELLGAAVAHAQGDGRDARRSGDAQESAQRREPDRSGGGPDVANADEPRLEVVQHGEAGERPPPLRTYGWAVEPDIRRVAHGIPARVDRLHGLGNAVVPEIPYRLGKAALTALQSTHKAA